MMMIIKKYILCPHIFYRSKKAGYLGRNLAVGNVLNTALLQSISQWNDQGLPRLHLLVKEI